MNIGKDVTRHSSIRWIAGFGVLLVLQSTGLANEGSPRDHDADRSQSTIPLPERPQTTGDSSSAPRPFEMKNAAIKFGVVAGIVVIFLLLLSRKHEKSPVPNKAVEVLGKIPLGARQTLQLIRFGRKLVLVESSNQGLKPISELTDPLEVQHMLDLVQSSRR